MDVESSGHVNVTKGSSADDDDNLFTISMPSYSGGQDPLDAPVFLIASVEWPEKAMTVAQNALSGQPISKEVSIAFMQNVDKDLRGQEEYPSVLSLGMILTLAPTPSREGDIPVMLSSYRHREKYLHVGPNAYAVTLHENDPGTGGYWFFEPRLPADFRIGLRQYMGPRSGQVSVSSACVVRFGAFSLVLTLAFAVAFSE